MQPPSSRPTITVMIEVRIHGRGGQGVVTAAELLSVAAFDEGRHAQAFPTFGSERTGAPVVAFCRIADAPIRSRDPIAEPDVVIVQDPTLLHQVDLFAGLDADGYLILNSAAGFDELGLGELAGMLRRERRVTIPATDLARKHLGRPVPNAPLLGAFAALTGAVSFDSLAAAIRAKFPGSIGERNVAAAEAAFVRTAARVKAPSHA
jgi:pyruvate ferredoxin oxidoreductase gamma subunit